MAKPIPKVGSHRNGRSSARKSARRIPKGVIHVQASFNNTIVTVTDVRGPAETIRGFKLTLSGELDGLPEQAFYLVGNINEATAKATNLEMETLGVGLPKGNGGMQRFPRAEQIGATGID
ncbi:hypothetical protein CXB51_001614 [Gossypium anomalum]|uniref:Ribosomal protein S11 n=1 Tax=Gossypium anomalum TaxID=47600 RepID=A0A8J5ZRV7_9ROSI|nr:hypothetical protein CXB51_001614 [Gossypium anomalum]